MANLEDLDLSRVPPETIDLLFGFIHQSQLELFPDEQPYYNIPTMVIHFAMLYYFEEMDCFIACGDEMKISSGKKGRDTMLTMSTGSSWDTGFGSIPITVSSTSTAVYEWTILCHASTVMYGISEFEPKTFGTYAFDTDKSWKCYGLHESGCKMSHFHDGEEFAECCEYRDGDELKLKVDTKEKIVEFKINDKFACNYEGIEDGEYRLACSLSGTDVYMEILDFIVS